MQKKLFILTTFLIMLTTFAYSALATNLGITGEANIRAVSDIRVTNIEYDSQENGASLSYDPKYTKDTITSGFILPNSNSSISYNVTIKNKGTIDQAIYDLQTISSNNNDMIILIDNKPINEALPMIVPFGTSKTIKITYKTTIPSNSVINIINKFIFKEVYYVEYNTKGGSSVETQIKYKDVDLTLEGKPTKNKYVFTGWTDEQNGQTVKYAPGSTYTLNEDKTLYAIYRQGEATFIDGGSFNVRIKQLANPLVQDIATETIDTNITSIVRANALPQGFTPTNDNIVSTQNSDFPIYAWYDNHTLYYYTVVDNPYMHTYSYVMFRGLSNASSIALSTINTSRTQTMHAMFMDCSSLTSIDLSNFNTSNVGNYTPESAMTHLFDGCSSLTTLDLSNFNTSKITSMYTMFKNCSSLTSITFGNDFDTTNVTNMQEMFNGCSSITNIDLSNFNTTSLRVMQDMFSGTSLHSIDLSSFNTSNVWTMRGLFYNCPSLTSITFGNNFDTSSVTNMSYFLSHDTSLISLDMSSFDMSSVTDFSSSLYQLTSLRQLKTPKVYPSNLSITLPKTLYDPSNNAYTTLATGNPTQTWIKLPYTVKFNANNGTGTMVDQKIGVDATTTLTTNAFTRTGYTFAGWNTQANGQGTAYLNNAQVTNLKTYNEEITLYAQWIGIDYTVTFDTNGGVKESNNLFKFDGSTKTVNGTTNNTTWGSDYLEFNGEDSYVALTQMNSNYMTLEATFSADEYRNSNQDIISNVETGGGAIFLSSSSLETPNRVCGEYYINGSYRYLCSNNQYDLNKKYHVIISYDGVKEKLFVNGNLEAELEIEGNIKTPYGNTIMALGGNPQGSTPNIEFFKGKIYSAAVYSNDKDTKSVTYGSQYGTLPSPTREGYTFERWTINYFDETQYYSLDNYHTVNDYRSAPIQLEANTKYKITVKRYNGFDGKHNGYLLISNNEYVNNMWSAIAHTDAPNYSLTNYIYTTGSDGLLYIGYSYVTQAQMTYIWQNTDVYIEKVKENTVNEVGITSTSIVNTNSNHTLQAVWQPHKYTITFDKNDNAATGTMSNQIMTYDETTNLTTNAFTKEGYTFAGWNTESDGSGTAYLDEASVNNLTSTNNGNITLYAQWIANQYTATFDYNGNLLYGLDNKGETRNGNRMKYTINNGTVTVTALKDDGYGFTTGRVYLEASKTYIFSSETDGIWLDAASGDSVEAYLMLDGEYNKYCMLNSNNNFEFTPDTTGTYWLRLDVNKNGQTHTFSNISIKEKNTTKQVTYDSPYGTLPTPTERPGYEFSGWSLLPSGYKQVEYIESTGTQYIDTSYIPSDDSGKIEAKFSFTSISNTTEFGYVYGVEANAAPWNCLATREYNGNDLNILTYSFSKYLSNSISENVVYDIEHSYYRINSTTTHTKYIINGNVKVDENATSSAVIQQDNLYLFAANINGPKRYGKLKLYYFRMYDDNNNIVRDFVPCVQESTGKAGLYDLVNGVFYGNAATSGDDFTVPNEEYYITSSTPVTQSKNHTLTAVWEKKEATFDTGQNFNAKIKQLAGDNNATYDTEDTNITSIQRANSLPQSWIAQDGTITPPSNNNIVSTNDSQYPIYAWFDNGTIYYNTEALNPYMNENAINMFRNLLNVTSIDINSIDTSKMKRTTYLFLNTKKLNSVDLSNFNTESTYDISGMFENTYFTSLDLSSFDTSKTIYMSFMFSSSANLRSIKISNKFDTSKVQTYRAMFQSCSSLETLDLSLFDMSSATNTTIMFSKMTSLKSLKTPNTIPSGVTIDLPKLMIDSSGNEYTQLTSTTPTSTWLYNPSTFIDGPTFNAKIKQLAGNTNATYETNDTNITSIQRYTNTPSSSTLENAEVVSTSDSYKPIYAWYDNGIIYYYSEANNLYMNENAYYMFRRLLELTTIDLSTIKTTKTKYMADLFAYNNKITTINLNTFDTSNVENMQGMFYRDTALTSLNLANFNTSNVTNMLYMFNESTSLTSIDLSSFDMTNVTRTSMLGSLTSLTSLKTPNTYPSDTSVTITLPTTLYDASGNSYSTLTSTSPTSTWLKTEYTPYTINYDLDGGTVSTANPTTYNINSNSITLNNPTKSGYTFKGWSGGKNLLDYNDLSTTAKSVNISVDNNGYISDSTPSSDGRVWGYADSNWKISLPAGTYTITLNYSTPTIANSSGFAVYKDDGTNIIAYWSDTIKNTTSFNKTFTINETMNIGIFIKGYDGVYRIQLEEGSSATSYEPYVSEQSTVTIPTGSVGNRTYKAIFETKVYTIDYDLDGGTLSTQNPAVYTVESSNITLNNPTKSGYRFVGWSEGKNLLNLSESIIGNATLNNDNSLTSNLNNTYYSYIIVDYLIDYFMNNLGKTYTFSMNEAISGRSMSIVINGTRTSGSTYQETNSIGDRKVSITIANDFTEITRIELRFNRLSTMHTDSYTRTDFQLEEGTKATLYEPYISEQSTVTIPSGSQGNRVYKAIWEEETQPTSYIPNLNANINKFNIDKIINKNILSLIFNSIITSILN